VYAPAGRLIDSKDDLLVALEKRLLFKKTLINFASYYAFSKSDDTQADIAFLEVLKSMRHSETVKMRIEEPMIHLYANDEQLLKDVVAKFAGFPQSYIDSISGPKSSQVAGILNSGAIIRKTDNGFKYKVLVRDGRYGSDIKLAALNYLMGLGEDTVLVPKGSAETLRKNTSYIWGVYFYTNDLKILTFLTLIHPNLVLNYHEMVVQ
jgi:hypothetical protein